MSQLSRFYINNEPYLFDDGNDLFTHETDSTKTIRKDQLGLDYHVSHLEIVDISGALFYHEPNWKQFRRVGPPYDSMSYDEFSALADKHEASLTAVSSDDLLSRLTALPPNPEQHQDTPSPVPIPRPRRR